MHRIRWARLAVAATSVLLAAGFGASASAHRAAPVPPGPVGQLGQGRHHLLADGAAFRLRRAVHPGLKLGLEYATKGTGKVNGKKIEITAVDDGTDPAKAVTAAKDLIGRGYKIIGGSTQSGIALQIAPLAEQNRVLNISGPARRISSRATTATRSAPVAIDPGHARGQGDPRQGRRQEDRRPRAGLGVRPGQRRGRSYLSRRARPHGEQHPRAGVGQRLHAVRGAGEEAAERRPALRGVGRHHWAALWRALSQQGVTRSVQIATGLAERATWSSYVPGINFLSHYVYNAPKNPVNDWLVKRMKRRNQLPDIFTPDGFVAAQMIVRAVQKGGGEDVDKMIKALEGWKFLGPKGPQRIRPEDLRDAPADVPGRLRTVKGKQVPVGQDVLAGQRPATIRPSPANDPSTLQPRGTHPGDAEPRARHRRRDHRRRCRPGGRCGRVPRDHRAEQGRQDLALQPAVGPLPADARDDRDRRPGRHQ